jgi:hypothetical protein
LVASQALSLFPYLQSIKKETNIRSTNPPQIDKSIPWGYFGGANQLQGEKYMGLDIYCTWMKPPFSKERQGIHRTRIK